MLQTVQTTLKRWIGGDAAAGMTTTEHYLLDTIRPGAIPDPAVLREQLARLRAEIAEADAEWSRLDARADASAFLQLQPVAERLQRLHAEADAFPAAIESAERRRTAFLALARMFDVVAADVAARTSVLLEQPPQDARERERQLRELNQVTRAHARLAARLAAISTSRQFKEPVDALRVLRGAAELTIRDLDRLRLPGHKPAFTWPAGIAELLDTVEDRTSKGHTA
jgi:hypothetical protein